MEVLVFNKIEDLSGLEAKGNFYKCGDKLENPHYLSWEPVRTPDPNFHLPSISASSLFSKFTIKYPMEKTPEQIQSEKLFKKICRKLGTTLRDHKMIGEGDHILVGLSGGKDSMILLEALAERKRAMPFDFTLTAAHVEAKGIGYKIDRQKLSSFCRS